MDVFLWSIAPQANVAWHERDDISLSRTEHARANAYRFRKDRETFIAARRFLRYVLGQHLQIEPNAVRIYQETGKKPAVQAGESGHRVHFNLARSAGSVLVGVTCDREIGVDIETVKTLADVDLLAPTVLSRTELSVWVTVPPTERPSTLLRAWTRKEALGKALGCGISCGPDTLEVSLAPVSNGQWAAASRMDSEPRWLMSHVDIQQETMACVVVQQRDADEAGLAYRDIEIAGEATEPLSGHRLRVTHGARLRVRRSGQAR